VSDATRRVGPIEVTAILDADFSAGPIVESFPDAPAEGLLAANAAFPSVSIGDDGWRLRIRSWLVRHPDGLLLLDTGIGGGTAPAHGWAPVVGALDERLAVIGVAPGDIDTVVISHVHDDHIGGVLTDAGAPRFPSATHLLQRADLDWVRELAVTSEEDAAIDTHIEPLVRDGLLTPLDGDHEVSAHVQLQHLPGHTPGHQIVHVVADHDRMTLSADTWNHPGQLANPDWPSGPDADHAGAAEARRALLEDLRSHPGTIVAPTHFGEAFGEVRSGPDGVATWHGLD
jgi:glyoxylase-like metal-dependent hydrolase (beta-lactamase superfamily II)